MTSGHLGNQQFLIRSPLPYHVIRLIFRSPPGQRSWTCPNQAEVWMTFADPHWQVKLVVIPVTLVSPVCHCRCHSPTHLSFDTSSPGTCILTSHLFVLSHHNTMQFSIQVRRWRADRRCMSILRAPLHTDMYLLLLLSMLDAVQYNSRICISFPTGSDPLCWSNTYHQIVPYTPQNKSARSFPLVKNTLECGQEKYCIFNAYSCYIFPGNLLHLTTLNLQCDDTPDHMAKHIPVPSTIRPPCPHVAFFYLLWPVPESSVETECKYPIKSRQVTNCAMADTNHTKF